jgi:hypothetical protein
MLVDNVNLLMQNSLLRLEWTKLAMGHDELRFLLVEVLNFYFYYCIYIVLHINNKILFVASLTLLLGCIFGDSNHFSRDGRST